MRRLDSSLAVRSVKNLQPSVPKALNHLYIVSAQYTEVKPLMGLKLFPEPADSFRRVHLEVPAL